MADSDFTSATQQTEPELRQTKYEPRGVLKKNLKMFVYLGAALLVIAAAIFSSSGKKTPSQSTAGKGQPPQPMLQDNTDNNVQDLKNQLQAERQKEQQQSALAAAVSTNQALAAPTPAQQAAAAAYGPIGVAAPCVSGQPCPQQSNGQAELTPEQQQMQQLAAKERERADDSRFASNLVYARSPDESQQQNQAPQQISGQSVPVSQRQPNSSLIPPHAPGEQQETTEGYKRPEEANIDSATGQPYLLYEGTVLDTILMNRLDGDAAGPVKVLVSNPLYSHDRQHVLIPDGTVVLGEVPRRSLRARHPASRNPRPRSLTASFRYRQPSPSAKAIASRSISRRIRCCLLTPTTPFRRRFEEVRWNGNHSPSSLH